MGWFSKEELLVMGDAFALARALASAAVEGSIGRGLVAGSVAGRDGDGHSVFWSNVISRPRDTFGAKYRQISTVCGGGRLTAAPG